MQYEGVIQYKDVIKKPFTLPRQISYPGEVDNWPGRMAWIIQLGNWKRRRKRREQLHIRAGII